MKKHLIITTIALCAVAASLHAQMQIGRQPAQPQRATVEVDLRVGGAKYAASGPGECKAAGQASIYGIPASLAVASHNAGSDSLTLTLWTPEHGGADMMKLAVAKGGKRYDVDTVTAPAKRDTKGSGKARFERAGPGGVFRIDAVTADAEKITGTITCSRFAAIQAEGG